MAGAIFCPVELSNVYFHCHPHSLYMLQPFVTVTPPSPLLLYTPLRRGREEDEGGEGEAGAERGREGEGAVVASEESGSGRREGVGGGGEPLTAMGFLHTKEAAILIQILTIWNIFFFFIFYARYSTLPLRFHCVGGC
jgi:hypothetical protein